MKKHYAYGLCSGLMVAGVLGNFSTNAGFGSLFGASAVTLILLMMDKSK